MNTKALGAIIAFTALTVALNFIRIPALYLPTFSYQLGDIAIVTALLLFGLGIGLTVAVLSMLISILINTSPVGPVGPMYYILSVLALLFGVYVFERFIKPKFAKNLTASKRATFSTVGGILSRTLIMLPLDYYIYGYLVSLVSGLSISDSYALVLSTMPLIVLYNVTVPLYVVPISYFITKSVSKYSNFALQTSLPGLVCNRK
jgi:riboflavin transporter FmnP